MPEQYVKGYCLKLNAEEAESLDYLMANGLNVHKVIKTFIVRTAQTVREENDIVAKVIGDE